MLIQQDKYDVKDFFRFMLREQVKDRSYKKMQYLLCNSQTKNSKRLQITM